MLSIYTLKSSNWGKFKDKGYHTAIQYVDTLYADDKISLIQKSNINSKLAFIQQHNKKQRRILGF